MNIERIENLEDPRLSPYRNLKSLNPARWTDGFIAEGKWVVERLLASSLDIDSVIVSEKRIESFLPAIQRDVPVWILPHSQVSELVGFDFHAGILGHGKRPDPNVTLSRLLDYCQQQRRVTLVACPHTTLPDNLGSIIRLSAAFGVAGLIVTPQSADPYARRTVRVSMGNVFQLPTVELTNLTTELAIFRKLGFQLVGCHQSPRSSDIRTYAWPEKSIIVFGNEAHGIPQPVIEACDHHVEIPIATNIDSLNVSSAAAIILYERKRQLDIV